MPFVNALEGANLHLPSGFSRFSIAVMPFGQRAGIDNPAAADGVDTPAFVNVAAKNQFRLPHFDKAAYALAAYMFAEQDAVIQSVEGRLMDQQEQRKIRCKEVNRTLQSLRELGFIRFIGCGNRTGQGFTHSCQREIRQNVITLMQADSLFG